MKTLPGFDQESVLALVIQLHEANPAKRSFSLMEIADAMWGPGSVASFAGATVVDAEGRIIRPRRLMPAWMETLNNILTKLGKKTRSRSQPLRSSSSLPRRSWWKTRASQARGDQLTDQNSKRAAG